MSTPDFPLWASALAGQMQKLRAPGAVLHQFEALFSAWIPAWRLSPQDTREPMRAPAGGPCG